MARWGQLAAALWYLGGFVALLGCTMAQVGPPAWASAWQLRHWGSDNRVLSFLPGFAALLVPLIIIASLPRRADWPFVCGAKDALWPRGAPAARVLAPEVLARRMHTGARICAGVAIGAVVIAGVACAWILLPGATRAGTRLPALTLAALTAPGTVLPGYGRITGATAWPHLAWRHEQTLRTTRLEDVFVPLTGAGWRAGDPVEMLEDDRLGLVAEIDPAGPREGELARGGLPGWQIQAMRNAGLAVIDDPVVLTRRMLDGAVPGPDPMDAIVPLILGGAVAIVFGLMAWSIRRAKQVVLFEKRTKNFFY